MQGHIKFSLHLSIIFWFCCITTGILMSCYPIIEVIRSSSEINGVIPIEPPMIVEFWTPFDKSKW